MLSEQESVSALQVVRLAYLRHANLISVDQPVPREVPLYKVATVRPGLFVAAVVYCTLAQDEIEADRIGGPNERLHGE